MYNYILLHFVIFMILLFILCFCYVMIIMMVIIDWFLSFISDVVLWVPFQSPGQIPTDCLNTPDAVPSIVVISRWYTVPISVRWLSSQSYLNYHISPIFQRTRMNLRWFIFICVSIFVCEGEEGERKFDCFHSRRV